MWWTGCPGCRRCEMSQATKKGRAQYAKFYGGPLDGGLEALGAEAPRYFVHRVVDRGGEAAFHRYARVDGPEAAVGKDFWRYEHEGSVRA